MRYGSGDYQYDLVDNWGDLPEGFEWHQVAGVAVDSSDNVYAYNRSAHQMMVFDRDGGFLSAWDETFAGPHGIHIGPDDCVYLADRDAHLISKYSLDGRLLLRLGTGQPSETGYTSNAEPVPKAAGPFNLPTGIAVTDEGDIFVSDGYGNSRVHRYDATGSLILSWGLPGKVNPGDFHLPHGIGLDHDGNVWSATARMAAFRSSMRMASSWRCSQVSGSRPTCTSDRRARSTSLSFRAG